jgi:hypothetical protein
MAEAQESGTDDHVARARVRFLEAHAESALVRLAVAERSARRAVGAIDDGGLTLRDLDAAEMAEWLVEADVRSTLGPQEASAALELLG